MKRDLGFTKSYHAYDTKYVLQVNIGTLIMCSSMEVYSCVGLCKLSAFTKLSKESPSLVGKAHVCDPILPVFVNRLGFPFAS